MFKKGGGRRKTGFGLATHRKKGKHTGSDRRGSDDNTSPERTEGDLDGKRARSTLRAADHCSFDNPNGKKRPREYSYGVEHKSQRPDPITLAVDFTILDMGTLKRYKRHYGLKVRQSITKAELAYAVAKHFASQTVDEGETIGNFMQAIDGHRKRARDDLRPP